VPEKLVEERMKFKSCDDFSKYAIAVSKGVQGMLHHPVKDELRNIKQSVLIIYGQQDALIPNKFLHPSLTLNEVVKTGTDNILKSKSLLINNAGHIVQYEQPGELNNAILTFLKTKDQIK
jgi:pimeloyl-ACP methyl ester carboxylesterase